MTQTTPEGFALKEKIASLQAELLAVTPRLPTLLREIHSTIKADPDQITLLSEDEICTIVCGLKKQTNTHIVNIAVASKSKKSLKSIGVDDI